MDKRIKTDLEVFNTIVAELNSLDIDTQKRTLQAIITFLGISDIKMTNIESNTTSPLVNKGISFSENRDMSPKEFLRNKAPKTDIERIACLGYYLTHYRETPYFKTIDLSNLNTEAAQPKLSNAAFSVVNATNSGLLVQAGKGSKQLSAVGEVFVQALPDREAAKASLSNFRVRKRSKKSPSKNGN